MSAVTPATVRGELARLGMAKPRELAEATGDSHERMFMLLLGMEERGLVERCGTFASGADLWRLPQPEPVDR